MAFTGVLVVDVLEVGGGVDGAGVLEVLPPGCGEKVPPLACDGSGVEPETIAFAGLPLPCEITNIAGCCLVAPPTGRLEPMSRPPQAPPLLDSVLSRWA